MEEYQKVLEKCKNEAGMVRCHGSTEATLCFESALVELYGRLRTQRALDIPGRDRAEKLKRSVDGRYEEYAKTTKKPRTLFDLTAEGIDLVKSLAFNGWEWMDVNTTDGYEMRSELVEGLYTIQEEPIPEVVPNPTKVLKDMSNKDARGRLKGETGKWKCGPFSISFLRVFSGESFRILMNGDFEMTPEAPVPIKLHRLNVYSNDDVLVMKLICVDGLLSVENYDDGKTTIRKLFDFINTASPGKIRASKAAGFLLAFYDEYSRVTEDEIYDPEPEDGSDDSDE
uniref:NS n=1 Tax=Wuhan spiny eel influenza virus TaxID=2116483 RepID=A0A2P1GNW0_9ORTO|nr:NS [Wuhan spiny eel influenza virus]